MNYFSPALLDGSVTTVKIADGAVVQAKLKSSVDSQSGTIGILNSVNVPMGPYCLFPDVEADQTGGVSRAVVYSAEVKATPAPNADFPVLVLVNYDSISVDDYAVAWRNLDA